MNVDNGGGAGSNQNQAACLDQTITAQHNTGHKSEGVSRCGRTIGKAALCSQKRLISGGANDNKQSSTKESRDISASLAALKLVRPSTFPTLKNWGSTCWFNASMVLMMTVLNHMDSRVWRINLHERESELAYRMEAFLVAIAEFHSHFQGISSGKMPGCSLELQQQALMDALYQLAPHLPTSSLKELFPLAIPEQQQDAAQFLTELMDVMNMPGNPEFAIAAGGEVTGLYQGKMLSRYTGINSYSLLNIKIPLKSSAPESVANGGQTDGLPACDGQTGPIAMSDCIRICLNPTKGMFLWEKEDFAGAGISCSNARTLAGHKRDFWLANLQKLRSFTIVLDMFDFQSGEGIKREDHAMAAFINQGNPIQLPVYNLNWQPCTLHGQLMALICHRGNTLHSGHYIALSFQDGNVIVHDDSIVMLLHDYLNCTLPGVPNTKEWSYQEFLVNLGFTPYIASYQNDENCC